MKDVSQFKARQVQKVVELLRKTQPEWDAAKAHEYAEMLVQLNLVIDAIAAERGYKPRGRNPLHWIRPHKREAKTHYDRNFLDLALRFGSRQTVQDFFNGRASPQSLANLIDDLIQSKPKERNHHGFCIRRSGPSAVA